jgi:hypothetical protein
VTIDGIDDLFRTMQDADRVGILVRGRLVEERATADLVGHELEDLYLRHVTSRERTHVAANEPA